MGRAPDLRPCPWRIYRPFVPRLCKWHHQARQMSTRTDHHTFRSNCDFRREQFVRMRCDRLVCGRVARKNEHPFPNSELSRSEMPPLPRRPSPTSTHSDPRVFIANQPHWCLSKSFPFQLGHHEDEDDRTCETGSAAFLFLSLSLRSFAERRFFSLTRARVQCGGAYRNGRQFSPKRPPSTSTAGC